MAEVAAMSEHKIETAAITKYTKRHCRRDNRSNDYAEALKLSTMAFIKSELGIEELSQQWFILAL